MDASDPLREDRLATAFGQTLRRPVTPSSLDLPLLIRICLDELSEVAACTELRAALLHQKTQDDGVRGPRDEKKIADLWFAAEQMRAACSRIIERVSGSSEEAPSADVRPFKRRA